MHARCCHQIFRDQYHCVIAFKILCIAHSLEDFDSGIVKQEDKFTFMNTCIKIFISFCPFYCPSFSKFANVKYKCVRQTFVSHIKISSCSELVPQ